MKYKLTKQLTVLLKTSDFKINYPNEVYEINDLCFIISFIVDCNNRDLIAELFGKTYVEQQIFNTYKNNYKKDEYLFVELIKEITEEELFYFKLKYDNIFKDLKL